MNEKHDQLNTVHRGPKSRREIFRGEIFRGERQRALQDGRSQWAHEWWSLRTPDRPHEGEELSWPCSHNGHREGEASGGSTTGITIQDALHAPH